MLAGVVLLLTITSYSQQTLKERATGEITGTVIDSASNSPLEYATITLFSGGRSKPLNGTTSDAAGHFILTDISPGKFSVAVEFIGYKIFSVGNITVTQKHEAVDLKNILLKKKQETLESVTVT